MSICQKLKHWIGATRKRRRISKFNNHTVAEILEQRCLLTVSNLTVSIHQAVDRNTPEVDIQWQTSELHEASEFEVWLDQVISANSHNSKVYYRTDVAGSGLDISHPVQQELAPGTYRVWVRETTGSTFSQWISHTFEVDDDDNPKTPIQLVVPERPEITVIRQGQGAAGQAISEGGIGWIGNSVLYNVWLGKYDANRTLRLYSEIKNVSQNTITLRELALAADREGRTTYSDVQNHSDLAQLASGDYQVFVRGINGAIDAEGVWNGEGPWSRGVPLSFHRIEGADAVPANLRVTPETRMTVEWDAVPYAEGYLLNVWKGPDYSSYSPVNIQVNGTKFVAGNEGIAGGGHSVSISAGDEVYIRVRAFGSEGILEGLQAGNFASATVVIPSSVAASDIGVPTVQGPARLVANSMPVLRWKHSVNASSYDVWFTSMQTRQRLFLATGITDNVFHLSPNALSQMSDLQLDNDDEYDSKTGLTDGTYRFWVQGRSSSSKVAGAWTNSYDFTVDSGKLTDVSLIDISNPAMLPLVSPNLVERYVQNGQQSILIANGLGESFSASVLARYEPDAERGLIRPVVTDDVTGSMRLRYPDLPIGRNAADMAFIDNDHLVVLSRSSNDVRIIDLVNWEVISEFALTPGVGGNAPDVMDLEVLANGQIMVVANRSDRLRLLEVDNHYQLQEISVEGASPEDQGFRLLQGRAVQISAVARDDGTYSIFMATPTVQGIVSAVYDPFTLQLTAAFNNDGTEIPPLSRSPFATPHLGGRTVTIETASGSSQTFYLSTDRNGFLTWINVSTNKSGFIDLVAYIDHSTRDPLSQDYRNPDDALVDPSRILQIDGNTIAVLNNRVLGVILGLEIDGSNHLQVRNSSTLDNGYDGAIFTTSSGDTKLYSSAGGGLYPIIGPDNVTVTDLQYDAVSKFWSAGNLQGFVLADAVNRAGVATDDSIILKFNAGRTSRISASSTPFNNTRSKLQLFTTEGVPYTDKDGPVATHFDSESDRLFLVAHLALPGGIDLPQKHFVGVVDVSDADNPVLHSAYPIAGDLKWYFVEFTADRIAVLDRLGSEVATVSNWRSPNAATTGGLIFNRRHPRTFGEIRSGRILTLTDGTTVVLHDTAPDKVFAVFEPGEILSSSPVPTVHTNTAGQWIYDAHVFDKDRVIAVTWDAKVLILNVRTGVFETIHQLDDQANVDLDLFGARETSYRNGVLSVASPGNGVVAEFRIAQYKDGLGYDVQLTSIVNAPNVVSTLLTASGQWVIEANRVRHFWH